MKKKNLNIVPDNDNDIDEIDIKQIHAVAQ